MAITIRVTPRTIERLVFVLLIIFFMSTTIYYSNKPVDSSDTTITEEVATNETAEETTIEETETTGEETKETTVQETEKTASTSYKDVEITIGWPPRYKIDNERATIDAMAFVVKNKMSKDLKSMKVKIYFWDSSSHESWQEYPKDTLTFPTIRAGTTSTQSLGLDMIGIRNFDLTKTFKFEFVNETDGEIKTITKTLKIEE